MVKTKSGIDLIYRYSWVAAVVLFVSIISIKELHLLDKIDPKLFVSIIENRTNFYPQLLVCFSIFFGFTLSAISLIISMSEMQTFKEFRNKNEDASKLWDSYLLALKYLGITCLVILVLIVFDRLNVLLSQNYTNILTFFRWLLVFLFIKSLEKLFWCFVIVRLLIDAIKEDWRKSRVSFIENEKNKLKVPDSELL